MLPALGQSSSGIHILILQYDSFCTVADFFTPNNCLLAPRSKFPCDRLAVSGTRLFGDLFGAGTLVATCRVRGKCFDFGCRYQQGQHYLQKLDLFERVASSEEEGTRISG